MGNRIPPHSKINAPIVAVQDEAGIRRHRPTVTQQPLFHQQLGRLRYQPWDFSCAGTFTHAEKVGLRGTQGGSEAPGGIPQSSKR